MSLYRFKYVHVTRMIDRRLPLLAGQCSMVVRFDQVAAETQKRLCSDINSNSIYGAIQIRILLLLLLLLLENFRRKPICQTIELTLDIQWYHSRFPENLQIIEKNGNFVKKCQTIYNHSFIRSNSASGIIYLNTT